MNAELIADAVPLADPMQRDPGTGRIRDVVVPAVEHVPARHRALLDAVRQAARLRFLEQRDEHLLEHDEVLIHFQLRIAADEAAHRVRAEQHRGIEHAQHEVMIACDVRPDRRRACCRSSRRRRGPTLFATWRARTRAARCLSNGAQRSRVFATGSSMASAGTSLSSRMQRGRELDVRRADVARELQPFFDGEVRIGVALVARRELLQGRRQDAEFHGLGRKGLSGHGSRALFDDGRPNGMMLRDAGHYKPYARTSRAEAVLAHMRNADRPSALARHLGHELYLVLEARLRERNAIFFGRHISRGLGNLDCGGIQVRES